MLRRNYEGVERMKLNCIHFAISGLLLSAFFTTSGFAQTCASPEVWMPGATGSVALEGSTCNAEGGVLATCDNAFGAPGAAYVALIHVTDDATFTRIDFTGGTGYTLAAYLVPQSNGCGDFPCTTTGDETTDILHTDVPEGHYYLIITGADFDAPGACGNFRAVSDGRWIQL
jgi:hypothetical protein